MSESNVDDFIEIVTNLNNKPVIKKVKADNKTANGCEPAENIEFPWEVNDFDQFDEIIKKLAYPDGNQNNMEKDKIYLKVI